MTTIFEIIVALLPVLLFLAVLIVLDSYKLVPPRSVAVAITIGCLSAAAVLFINRWLIDLLSVNLPIFTRYIAPAAEELIKALYVIFLIRTRRVGFIVDGAIYGFAIGAGFAMVENIYYLNSITDAGIALWIVRGFGTAAIHGCTSAVFGMISKNLSDNRDSNNFLLFIPGLILAFIIHSTFNHFILPPVISTLVVLVVSPLILLAVFNRSEVATRHWLGKQWDTDLELLEAITTGEISQTRVGIYLDTLKNRFPNKVVADMLCFLRLHLELAMTAKGLMLMREAGVKPPMDQETKAKFTELKYLEKSIGKTGKLAILPFLHTSGRNLWQLHLLGK